MEIKIRAWDDDYRMMIYDFSTEKNMMGLVVGFDEEDRLTAFWEGSLGEDLPLMLYTGFDDKDGINIFDQDIYEERFKDGSVFIDKVDFKSFIMNLDMKKLRRIRVIGNTYEDPELLLP